MEKLRNTGQSSRAKRPSPWRYLFFLLIGAVLVGGFGWQIKNNPDWTKKLTNQTTDYNHSQIDLKLFWQVYDLLQSHYLDSDKLTEKDLIYGAISGMVSATGDPYTSFFTPTDNEGFKDGLEGVYGGIGAQLGFEEKQLVIIAPLEGSPAEKAGMKAGDPILAVNGESTNGWSLAKAVQQIRGEAGTKVKLTLVPGEVELEREEIKIPAVRLTWEEGNIANIKVLRFGSDTVDAWDKEVEKVVEQGAKGVVLDVRNNPGGLLNAAIYLGSDFFDQGIVVSKESKLGTTDYRVDHQCRLCTVPVVVLVNKGSASASEILAGAIQKRNRGILLGEKSFGKGTVQESIELDEGAAVHITTARWLLPNGENIHEAGLMPDVEVPTENPSGPFGGGEKDTQLQKALEELKSK